MVIGVKLTKLTPSQARAPSGAELQRDRLWLAIKTDQRHYRRQQIVIKPITIVGKQHLHSSQEL